MSSLVKLRDKMNELNLDSAIILDELNQRYLANFAFSDGFLLITQRSAYLVTDFRYFEMAERSADKAFSVVMPDNRIEFISNILKNDCCITLGFEGACITYEMYRYYHNKLAPVELVDLGGAVEELRRIKTPDEVALIQKAQSVTDKAFSEVLKRLNPNMTELDVAVELEYAMRKNGADGFAFDTIAVSGDASALPHGAPRNEKLHKGFLTMDFGAKVNGYCSDMTRTVVIGRADAEMKKIYSTVLSAQQKALDFLKEGVDCGEADRLAREVIDKEYSGTFGHSLGHAVGLYIHEAPGLSRKYVGTKAQVGEIFTVEPGIYIFGKYGCRIEDMVAIKRYGIHNFTRSPKELIEIT